MFDIFNWGKNNMAGPDYPPSATMDRPKQPGWLKKGAEGSSTLTREKLISHNAKDALQAKRATGWSNDPTPHPENDATNIRPSKMGEGKVPNSQCPWDYEPSKGMVHESELTHPMDIPRPETEYKKPKKMTKTTQASEGSLTNVRPDVDNYLANLKKIYS